MTKKKPLKLESLKVMSFKTSTKHIKGGWEFTRDEYTQREVHCKTGTC